MPADALGLVLVPGTTPKRATAAGKPKPEKDQFLAEMEADINAAVNTANRKTKRGKK